MYPSARLWSESCSKNMDHTSSPDVPANWLGSPATPRSTTGTKSGRRARIICLVPMTLFMSAVRPFSFTGCLMR